VGEPSHSKGGVDLKTALETVIGDTGAVETEYDGFVITILDHRLFPWYDVFNILSGESFKVWLDKKEENLVIVCAHKID